MAIKKDITVTVQGQKSIMSDDNIYIYQGDKDIDLYFTIIDNRFEFEATTVKKYNFTLRKPDGDLLPETSITPMADNKAKLTITEDMANELSETGQYDILIHLYDERGARITIPEISFEVKRPLMTTNVLTNSGLVSSAILDDINEKLTRLNPDGKYNRTIWQKGDLITKEKLNKIEYELEDLNNNQVDVSTQLNEKANEIDLEIERNRIDNLAKLGEGSTTGDAELIDARVGADGVTYTNVGSSIRKQIGDISEYLNSYGTIQTPTLINGKFITANGTMSENLSSTCTDYIDVLGNNQIKVYNAYLNDARCICSYDENKTFISVLATNKGVEPIDILLNLPLNTKYIRATGKPNLPIKISHSNMYQNVNDRLNAIISEIENGKTIIYSNDKNFWQQKNITTSGEIDSNFTNSNILSNIINEKTNIKVPSGFMYAIAKYNQDGTWNSRSSWVKGSTETVIDWTYSYRIVFVTEYTSSKTLDEMLSNLELVSYKEPSKEEKAVNFINRFTCSDTGNKIMHFSIDDTWLCIKDITNNSYTSIFENTFLNKLKELHDLYGICVTLNTFNTNTTDSNYSILNVPTKYQAEFKANKSWLKFAFHGEDETSNYDTSTGISESYDKFISGIYKLTGDYECIDSFTRLGYFGGSLKNVLTIKNKQYGVKGLLCADTTNRVSYYLNDEQNKVVQKKGKYLDVENEIVMFKTITRSVPDMIKEIENNLSYQKYVEIFMHEYEGNPTFSNVAKWAKENGYIFAFPSDIVT